MFQNLATKNYEKSLKIKALAELELRKRAKSQLSFEEYLKTVTPSFQWDWAYLKYIRELLKPIIYEKNKKIMVSIPPRHGKSEMITVRLPAYILEFFKEKRIIVGAYNQNLANKFSRKTRRIVAERLSLSKERSAVEDWETGLGGSYRAVGVGSGITGQGGDLIIIDDPVKNREEANSEAYQQKCWAWYRDDLYTRLEPGANMILIMTRWSQLDLAGQILASENASDWIVINLPALAEENDPLGRQVGQALCPERYDEKALNQIKSVLGNSFFALFQGRPTAVEGQIFKREWWNYYSSFDEVPIKGRIIQSWDTAFKKNSKSDYSVCTTWKFCENGAYLLNRWKERVEFPELKEAAKQLALRFKPSQINIEDKASGQSLIQELKRKSALPVIAVAVDADKIARANAVSAYIKAGNVYLPDFEPWTIDYVDVMSNFPNGAHDDDVDSTTQALSAHMYANNFGFLDYIMNKTKKVDTQ